MSYFEFPHTRNYEGDLGFIIKSIIELNEKYDVFFAENHIKFADPIQWDITTQYSPYTIVSDSATDGAYISKQAVPTGIQITNSDYWEFIGYLTIDAFARLQISDILRFICNIYESTTTATANRSVGDFVMIESHFYQVTAPITSGDEYTTGTNITATTIEDMIVYICRVNIPFVTPEMFGAKGDGTTNDTLAIRSAVATGKPVVLNNTYLVSIDDNLISIDLPDNADISGHGSIILEANNSTNYSIFRILNHNNISIRDITIVGDRASHTGITGEWGFGIHIDGGENINISGVDISECWGDGIYLGHVGDNTEQTKNVTITNSFIHHNRRNNISVTIGENIIIDSNIITTADGTAPEAGIDIEPNSGELVDGCIISNNHIIDNEAIGVAINHFTETDTVNIKVDNNLITGSPDAILGYVQGLKGTNDLITNNTVIASKSGVGGTNYTAQIINNNFKIVSITTDIPFLLNGVGLLFQGNTLAVDTGASVVLQANTTSSQAIIKDNNFTRLWPARNGYCIECEDSITIDGNNFEGSMQYLQSMIYLNGDNKVYITNNKCHAYSNAPHGFIICKTDFASNRERVAFNTVEVESYLANKTMKAFYNVVNGAV